VALIINGDLLVLEPNIYIILERYWISLPLVV